MGKWKKRCWLGMACAVFSLSGMAFGETTLEEMRWDQRVVLYHLGDEDSVPVIERSISACREQLEERDIVLVSLGEFSIGDPLSLSVSSAESAELRARFRVAPNSTEFLLIGKDGGLKARQSGQLDWSELFQLIDQMPMRRAEISRQAAGEDSE